MIGIIFSVDKNGVIGTGNDLCFKTKSDMNHFKTVTSNSTCIMGYNTFVSLNGFKLPNREMIIVTSKQIDGYACYPDLKLAIDNAKHENVWLIGGKGIIESGIEFADTVWITKFDHECVGADQVSIGQSFFATLGSWFVVDTKIDLSDDTYRASAYRYTVIKETDHLNAL